MTPLQLRIKTLRAQAAREGKMEHLQEAFVKVAEMLLGDEWIDAGSVECGKYFQIQGKAGEFIRVTPTGAILNSTMMSEILARGDVFVVNLNAKHHTFFFISRICKVRYI